VRIQPAIWPFNRPSAFTLIELLIVVAIIAILAAIAVPNFLEAQVRAKVSRVENDLRSLAVALEAYCVEWNDYPNKSDEGILAGYRGPDRGLLKLTTPLAFLSSIPLDPFDRELADFTSSGGTTQWGRLTYEMASTGCAPHSPKGWSVYSSAPDGRDDTGPGVPEYPYETMETMFYDPTNGTISRGDIHRFGPEIFRNKIRLR